MMTSIQLLLLIFFTYLIGEDIESKVGDDNSVIFLEKAYDGMKTFFISCLQHYS